MADIVKVELTPGRPIWLYTEVELPVGEPFVAGPDPAGDIARACAHFLAEPQGGVSRDSLYSRIRRRFQGASLVAAADLWVRVYDGAGQRFDVQKSRVADDRAVPPFMSLEEMKVVSAALGWPDPEWLHDVTEKAVTRILEGKAGP